jgi:KDO2-lipid IV(A) lauroyltransferase
VPLPTVGARVSARATYLGFRLAAIVVRFVPERFAELAARGIGRLFALLMPSRRRQAERNLRRVHGDALRGPALSRAVARTFDSYGRYWLELLRLPWVLARDPAAVDVGFTLANREHLDAAVAGGRGVILALPHVGGWEHAGAWLAGQGLPPTVVVEPVEPPELFEWFADVRRRLGMTVVPLGPDAGPAVMRALRAGGVICLLCDRDLAGDGIPVEFFGEETTLPAGPATLALRTGAPIVPAAVYFGPDGRHDAVVLPPVPAEREGRLRDDVRRVTQDLARQFEDLIRVAPEQWHLLQPNWPSDHLSDGPSDGEAGG